MSEYRISFYPVAFGFGPLATASYIAQEIRQLAGNSITLSLVPDKMGNLEYPTSLLQCFDEVERMPNCSPADLHLTVMNEKAVRALNERNKRIFIVDVLSWLWDGKYAAASFAERYYYQRIPWLNGCGCASSLPDNDRSLLRSYAIRGGGVLCTAGLTTVLECLSSGIPFGLLPPQNYSQARLSCILHG